jgi:chemotaxis protein MotB
MSRRHKAHEEHENNERWLLTYADMITLLLALFILLFSIASTHKPMFGQVAASIRNAMAEPNGGAVALPFDLQPRGAGPIGLGPRPLQGYGAEMRPAPVAPPVPENTKALEHAIRNAGLQLNVRVVQANTGVAIRLQTDVLFDTGTAELTTAAQPVLGKVAEFLETLRGYTVRVEGYTDSRPIQTPQFPSNWELSSGRALAVLHALVADGVDASILTAGGNGVNNPVASNLTPTGQAANRRVEIVITHVVERVAP